MNVLMVIVRKLTCECLIPSASISNKARSAGMRDAILIIFRPPDGWPGKWQIHFFKNT
jgi:hypothetical protein